MFSISLPYARLQTAFDNARIFRIHRYPREPKKKKNPPCVDRVICIPQYQSTCAGGLHSLLRLVPRTSPSDILRESNKILNYNDYCRDLLCSDAYHSLLRALHRHGMTLQRPVLFFHLFLTTIYHPAAGAHTLHVHPINSPEALYRLPIYHLGDQHAECAISFNVRSTVYGI